jgi:hypothetical protein
MKIHPAMSRGRSISCLLTLFSLVFLAYSLLFCKFSCFGEYHGNIALPTNALYARTVDYLLGHLR